MMAQEPTFYFGMPGESTAGEISLEGLRAIFSQIEAELQRSEVFQRALTHLQHMPDGGSGSIQFLLKVVGREAIRLSLRHFVRPSKPEREAPNEDLAIPETDAPPAAPSEVKTSRSKARVELPPCPAVSVTPAQPKPAVKKKPRKLTKAELAAQAFAQQRVECLRQLGVEIQQARLAKSLSLRQLHCRTLVPLYQLQALEAGRIDQLPEDIYVRGFIRRIGDALELDGARMAASIPSLDTSKSVVPSWYRPNVRTGFYLEPVHLYLGYATLMAGGLFWLSHQIPSTSSQPLPMPGGTPASQEDTKPSEGKISQKSQGAIAAIAPPEIHSPLQAAHN